MADQTFVIVGASLAGATAAQTLREEGFGGGIVLIGSEPDRPYERPPLSKDYLQGGSERADMFVHPEPWYAEHDVDLRLATTVTAIDRDAHEVVVDGGEPVRYDKLLLTTGSEPRRLDVPGAGLDGVHYLRTVQDCEQIKSALGGSPRNVVVIGAGWIGLETAAAARNAGRAVTVLENAELPLLHVLGTEMAEVFADLHREHGVDLRLGVTVEEIVGTHRRVQSVRLGSGEEIPADLVLVGVGITPVTQLAAGAGLAVDNGIVTDEHLRTSDPAIFAAGDVANARHPVLGKHIRVEHWANAQRQGAVAARSMLGQDASDGRPPYFFSDQYDLGMEYNGYVETGGYDRVVIRGDRQAREFIAFWVSSGRVLAGMNVNIWDVSDDIENLVGRAVDLEQLADPDVPLTAL